MPFRIYPGGLSVSRSFGDLMAKMSMFGGKKGVLISEPEIKVFKYDSSIDYLFIGCDGIFDIFSTEKLNNFLHE